MVFESMWPEKMTVLNFSKRNRFFCTPLFKHDALYLEFHRMLSQTGKHSVSYHVFLNNKKCWSNSFIVVFLLKNKTMLKEEWKLLLSIHPQFQSGTNNTHHNLLNQAFAKSVWKRSENISIVQRLQSRTLRLYSVVL